MRSTRSTRLRMVRSTASTGRSPSPRTRRKSMPASSRAARTASRSSTIESYGVRCPLRRVCTPFRCTTSSRVKRAVRVARGTMTSSWRPPSEMVGCPKVGTGSAARKARPEAFGTRSSSRSSSRCSLMRRPPFPVSSVCARSGVVRGRSGGRPPAFVRGCRAGGSSPRRRRPASSYEVAGDGTAGAAPASPVPGIRRCRSVVVAWIHDRAGQDEEVTGCRMHASP